MIVMQIGEMPDRIRQWASCGEHRVIKSKADPGFALARKLVAAGYDPDEPLEIKRGEMVCLRFKSLSAAAGLIVEESDKVDIHIRKYRPSPLGRLGSGLVKADEDDEE